MLFLIELVALFQDTENKKKKKWRTNLWEEIELHLKVNECALLSITAFVQIANKMMQMKNIYEWHIHLYVKAYRQSEWTRIFKLRKHCIRRTYYVLCILKILFVTMYYYYHHSFPNEHTKKKKNKFISTNSTSSLQNHIHSDTIYMQLLRYLKLTIFFHILVRYNWRLLQFHAFFFSFFT